MNINEQVIATYKAYCELEAIYPTAKKIPAPSEGDPLAIPLRVNRLAKKSLMAAYSLAILADIWNRAHNKPQNVKVSNIFKECAPLLFEKDREICLNYTLCSNVDDLKTKHGELIEKSANIIERAKELLSFIQKLTLK